MTSWKSLQDPSSGDFTYSVDVQGLAQLFLRRGSDIVYRSGPWDGIRFGGGPPVNYWRQASPTMCKWDYLISYLAHGGGLPLTPINCILMCPPVKCLYVYRENTEKKNRRVAESENTEKRENREE